MQKHYAAVRAACKLDFDRAVTEIEDDDRGTFDLDRCYNGWSDLMLELIVAAISICILILWWCLVSNSAILVL